MRSVLSVSLPKKIASELEVYAKDTGRNKSDIVRESTMTANDGWILPTM